MGPWDYGNISLFFAYCYIEVLRWLKKQINFKFNGIVLLRECDINQFHGFLPEKMNTSNISHHCRNLNRRLHIIARHHDWDSTVNMHLCQTDHTVSPKWKYIRWSVTQSTFWRGRTKKEQQRHKRDRQWCKEPLLGALIFRQNLFLTFWCKSDILHEKHTSCINDAAMLQKKITWKYFHCLIN